MDNLARYIIRASFSQERMQYLADEGTVISKPPAKAHAPPAGKYAVDGSYTVFPDNTVYGDPDYSWDAHITT
jgi:hypothetical protein